MAEPIDLANTPHGKLIAKQAAAKAASINGVLAALEDMTSTMLPEAVFVQSFLPFFCGEKDVEGKDILGIWIGISGSPTSEVTIVDNINRPLFNVPPLMDTSTINRFDNAERGVGIGAIMALAQEYGNNIPAMGTRILNENLAKKSVALRMDSPLRSAYEQRWIEIFKRYGKIKVDANAPVIKNAADIDDDEMDFS